MCENDNKISGTNFPPKWFSGHVECNSDNFLEKNSMERQKIFAIMLSNQCPETSSKQNNFRDQNVPSNCSSGQVECNFENPETV